MWRVSAGWRLRRNSPDEEVMGPNMNFSEVSTTMKCIISLTIQSAVAFPGVSAEQLHACYCFQMCSTIRIRLRARGSRGDRCISGGSDVFIPTKPKNCEPVRSTLVSSERSCVLEYSFSKHRANGFISVGRYMVVYTALGITRSYLDFTKTAYDDSQVAKALKSASPRSTIDP